MLFKEFDPVRFTKWINEKFEETRDGNIRYKMADFARFLGIEYSTISIWLLGKLTNRPSYEMCNVLIEKFGFDAYEPLGIEPPSKSEFVSGFPPGTDVEALFSAVEEIREEGLYKGKAKTSPEDVKRIREVFAKYGVNLSSNRDD